MRKLADEFSRKQDAGEDDESDSNYWCLTCRKKKGIQKKRNKKVQSNDTSSGNCLSLDSQPNHKSSSFGKKSKDQTPGFNHRKSTDDTTRVPGKRNSNSSSPKWNLLRNADGLITVSIVNSFPRLNYHTIPKYLSFFFDPISLLGWCFNCRFPATGMYYSKNFFVNHLLLPRLPLNFKIS